MRKSTVSRGALYVLFATISPLLLEDHPVMAWIQTIMFTAMGVALIIKGARSQKL